MDRRPICVAALVIIGLGIGASASRATGCTAGADATVSTVGDESALASSGCDVEGRSGEADVSVRYDRGEAVLLVTDHNRVDADGDGSDDTGGDGHVSAGCGPPEEWGTVTGIVCPVLTGL